MSKRCEVRGFSLLEVLLASLIFSSVIGGLAAAWRFHEKSLQKYRNQNAARTILTQELERICAHTYENLDEAVGTRSFDLIRTVDGVATTETFTVTSTLSENSEGSLKDIVATVKFVDQGENHDFTVRTREFRSQ